ncbi:hypothetical protein Tsubulata_012804 [Turnera subulata]|uniref:Peptidase A1 domain-containing protein n=1 Tax=Turnera subulata TaxID=218843 RepID=A0A9Q0FGT4_9ROSI|nr:hypothetical protein Tsubulata_012804 [Turnera subulata]
MAAVQASAVKLCFLSFFLTTLVLLSSAAAAVAATGSRKIVAKLIHRDSVFSPHYNPKANKTDIARRAIESSIARYHYLSAKASSSPPVDTTNDYCGGITPESSGGQFMVNFSIGSPPVPQLAGMDTGSSLLWVQCLPCVHCFEQYSPIFDPSKSSTYQPVSCNDPLCRVTNPDRCDPDNNCKYSVGYLDTSNTKGIFSTETLSFVTSDEGVSTVPGAFFGCGHDNDAFNGDASGILGLGPASTSLVAKMGSKFSYCLGNLEDGSYPYSHLILGDGAQIEGTSTPVEVFKDLYYLTLEGISVGEKMLNISPQVFVKHPSANDGVVIDSGTTLNFLPEIAHEALMDEIKILLDGKLVRVEEPSTPTNLCYKGTIAADLGGFPFVSYHFAGGVNLELDPPSMFQPYGEGEFCSSVHQSPFDGLTVIGAFAQQGYNIGFDVAALQAYFQRIDCQHLEN